MNNIMNMSINIYIYYMYTYVNAYAEISRYVYIEREVCVYI